MSMTFAHFTIGQDEQFSIVNDGSYLELGMNKPFPSGMHEDAAKVRLTNAGYGPKILEAVADLSEALRFESSHESPFAILDIGGDHGSNTVYIKNDGHFMCEYMLINEERVVELMTQHGWPPKVIAKTIALGRQVQHRHFEKIHKRENPDAESAMRNMADEQDVERFVAKIQAATAPAPPPQ